MLIISAVLQFSRGDVFDGAVAGTFGPSWLIYGAFQTLYAARVPAAQLGSSTSLLLAVFAVVTLYLAIASLRTDLVTVAILWLAFAGLVLLSIGAGASIGNVTKADIVRTYFAEDHLNDVIAVHPGRSEAGADPTRCGADERLTTDWLRARPGAMT